MAKATLTISSKNYSSWSLRGWLLARFAGLEFDEVMVPPDDADARKELLLLSPSILVPCLTHDGIKVWDTLAIARVPQRDRSPAPACYPPTARRARTAARSAARCTRGSRACASALPMNLKRTFPGHKVWARRPGRHRAHHGDLARVPRGLWRAVSLRRALHGRRDVRAGGDALPDLRRQARRAVRGYGERIMAMPEMLEWVAAAKREPDDIDELDMEF